MNKIKRWIIQKEGLEMEYCNASTYEIALEIALGLHKIRVCEFKELKV